MLSPNKENPLKEALEAILREVSPSYPLMPIFAEKEKVAFNVVCPDGKILATIGNTPCSLSSGPHNVVITKDSEKQVTVKITTEFNSETTNEGHLNLDLNPYENSIALALTETDLVFSLASAFMSKANSEGEFCIGGFIVPAKGNSIQENFLLHFQGLELKETNSPTKTKVVFTFKYKVYTSKAFTPSQIMKTVDDYYFRRLDCSFKQVH